MQFLAFLLHCEKLFLTTCFSFDEVSLKREVKLVVIIFNVRAIFTEASGSTSHLDPSNLPFALWNLADLAKICI